ncbi:MAG TPA: baseplate J/gp47 family protein [Anaerolineales bacterium]|nr:baseplate J/gp47 family protein [Anaerolineales bacterium]
MKTQILQLETYDDQVSACDKIKWSQADRILLVWPARGKILNRKLDLLLLKRQSFAQGAKLALVTRDAKIRALAHRQGIPTFSSVRKAQSKAWRLPRRFRSLQDISSPVKKDLADHETASQRSDIEYWRKEKRFPPANLQSTLLRLALFTVGALAFFTVAALLYPYAEITLQPEIQWQEANLVIMPDEMITQPSIDGRVPARMLTVVVEGRDSITVSGTILFPDTHSTGFVEFTNLTDSAVDIPKGLVVRSTNGQRFEVVEQGTIPAGSGEIVSIPVRSLLPGSAGNLPSGSIGSIEGNLMTFASVSNPNILVSGTDRRMPAPTESDRENLSEKLHQELQASAILQLHEQLSPGDYLIPHSLKLSQIIEEIYLPESNNPANQLSLSLRLEYHAQYISSDDLTLLFNSVFETNPSGNTQSIPGSLVIETSPDSQNNLSEQYSIRITGRRKIREIIRNAEVIANVIGLTPPRAQEQLSSRYDLEKAPQITILPAWWPRLPFIPLRITVKVID